VSVTLVPALTGAALVGIGLYGLIAANGALNRILGFNVLGGGAFLIFGFIARRGAGAGFPADPVPQALVITGIVVGFSATALAAALVVRLAATRSIEHRTKPDAESGE
jgi:multicomponent Na+:H+ antiporter subunit C